MRLLCCVASGLILLGLASRAAAHETPAEREGRAMAVRSKRPLPRRANDERPPAAQNERDARRGERNISVAALLGYGSLLEGGPVNPWGVGFGARGGYNLGSVFLGARFVFYVGEEPSSVWEIGLEAGYDLREGIFTARPGVGVGLGSLSLASSPTTMESETELYFAPGLALLFDVAQDIFIGTEGRVQLLFAEPRREALIVLGNFGMRF